MRGGGGGSDWWLAAGESVPCLCTAFRTYLQPASVHTSHTSYTRSNRCAGGGSVLAVVGEGGALCLLDVTQPLDRRQQPHARTSHLKAVLSQTSSTSAPEASAGSRVLPNPTGGQGRALAELVAAAVPALGGGEVGGDGLGSEPALLLAAPAALRSALMLPRPWALLLRLLVQVSEGRLGALGSLRERWWQL